MLIRFLMKNYHIIHNCNTNDLFIKLKILKLEQLYEKLSIIKVLLMLYYI